LLLPEGREGFPARADRLLFADQGFAVERVSYAATIPGAGVIAG